MKKGQKEIYETLKIIDYARIINFIRVLYASLSYSITPGYFIQDGIYKKINCLLMKSKYKNIQSNICYLIISIFLMSCHSYHTHIIAYNIKNKADDESLLKYDTSSDPSIYNWKRSKKIKNGTVKVAKYFAEISSRGPVSTINHKAVEYALQERYFEAAIIFQEALEEAPHSPEIYNNLGIIYEAQGNYDQAFNMYSRACLIDDKNSFFRKNFISFDEYKPK